MTEISEPPPPLETTSAVDALAPTKVSDQTSRYLDTLDNADLVKQVEGLVTEIRHCDVENQVFENFLQKNDPSLIVGMAQILELALKAQQTQGASSLSEKREMSISLRASSSRRTTSIVRLTTPTASTSDRGPRINLSQKMELSIRELEDMQLLLEDFLKKSHHSKCNLKAKLEELNVRETEVKDARAIFEQTIVTEGVDKLTGKIPAEKFLRYMDEWLRSAESTIEKMRLRTSTLKALFLKVCTQLVQKEELGEIIDAVDFDKLRIENKDLSEKIDEKTYHLLELKRMNGAVNLVLTTNRKYLLKQVQDIKKIKNLIKTKERDIIDLNNEYDIVAQQVEKEKDKFDKTYDLTLNYTVPDTLEYIKTKSQLTDLKRQLKTWERKTYVKQFELKSCIRQMKNLTGIPYAQPSWFEIVEEDSSDSFLTWGNLFNDQESNKGSEDF